MILWDGYIYFGIWILIDISFKRKINNLFKIKFEYILLLLLYYFVFKLEKVFKICRLNFS